MLSNDTYDRIARAYYRLKSSGHSHDDAVSRCVDLFECEHLDVALAIAKDDALARECRCEYCRDKEMDD